MIKIPFSIIPTQVLKNWSKPFQGIGERLKKGLPEIDLELRYAEAGLNGREYIASSIVSSIIFFFLILIISLLFLLNLQNKHPYLFSFLIALVFTLFGFFQQLYYPKLISAKRVRSIEINLMPALQNILIQINSGVPLYEALVAVANSNFGELSLEFKKAVKKISAGEDAIIALDNVALNNPSIFFRRTIWQLTNGLKAGGDISKVLKEVTRALSEEQLISIQRYGSQLNPLAMFYMLMAVIMPSLGITFIIIISSFVSLQEKVTKLIFLGMILLVVFFQIMFIGLIRSKRPALMG